MYGVVFGRHIVNMEQREEKRGHTEVGLVGLAVHVGSQ